MKNGKYTGKELGLPNIKYIWFKDDKLHRENDLAVEYNDGTKFWYINGQLHRLDGPAIEFVDGYKKWYFNGELHRLDGPACEWSDGSKEWYYNGEQINCQSESEFKRIIKLLVFK